MLMKFISVDFEFNYIMASNTKVVIKLSGEVFLNSKSKGKDDRLRRIKEISELLDSLNRTGHKIIAVAGGSAIAREYIEIGRKFKADEATLDQIGIQASRLNARILTISCKESDPRISDDLNEIVSMANSGRIVITGGLFPGQSTNAVAALIAEKFKADILINTTSVENIYSSDPKKKGTKNKKLTKYDKIHVDKLEKILKQNNVRAGTYELFDLNALQIIKRSSIKCRIIKCTPNNISKAVKNENVGTQIEY